MSGEPSFESLIHFFGAIESIGESMNLTVSYSTKLVIEGVNYQISDWKFVLIQHPRPVKRRRTNQTILSLFEKGSKLVFIFLDNLNEGEGSLYIQKSTVGIYRKSLEDQ